MNGAIHPPKPARIALKWLAVQGFYVLATDSTSRAFVDSDEAVAAVCAALDPRLNEMPLGSC